MQVEWKHCESTLKEKLCHTHLNLFQPILGFHNLSLLFLIHGEGWLGWE